MYSLTTAPITPGDVASAIIKKWSRIVNEFVNNALKEKYNVQMVQNSAHILMFFFFASRVVSVSSSKSPNVLPSFSEVEKKVITKQMAATAIPIQWYCIKLETELFLLIKLNKIKHISPSIAGVKNCIKIKRIALVLFFIPPRPGL